MNHWEILITVVQQQSLNKASSILNLSQPALSRKMMKLEEELGVELFRRKGKRLELTRAGELCYEHALEQQRLQRKLDDTLRLYRTETKPASIIIGASLTTLQSTLPDLVTIYIREHPLTDIKAITGKTHEVVPLVKEKKVDIGLVASRIDDPQLSSVPLFDDSLCLVLPSGHPYADREELTIGDLHELPMILFSRGTWYRVLMDEMFMRYSVHPDVKMEIDSFEAIVRLVSTCQTATLLPESYVRHPLVDNNELTVRFIPELEQTKRTTSLLFKKEAAMEPAIQLFIDLAVKYYRA
ncbi:LysR family transcriptional regulator [Paenibacillus sp. YYML68]|uniref:LysR family transcriptional regulator n=1 Tax=Paenibacillus sp. YYML68 TaxID=2909250 RepID=UPI0024905B52|nr:LysR family transcriptional regulator [Paenibacillus sp. YYML68]